MLVACTRLAERDFDEFAFVWLGRGVIHEWQVAALFGVVACRFEATVTALPSVVMPAVASVALLTHSDVIGSFRAKVGEKDDAPKAAPTMAHKPLTLLFDCGLAPVLPLDKPGGYCNEVPLTGLLMESRLPL